MKRWKKNLLVLALLSFAVIFANVTPKYHTVSAASKTTLNYKKKTLSKGQTLKLKVKGTKKKVKWSSSKKKVASVTSKGKVTAKKKGNAVITAKVGSKKYRCKIKVVLPEKPAVDNNKTPETPAPKKTEEPQAESKPAEPSEPEPEPLSYPTEPPLAVDFESLKAINPDVKGWLYIEALDISYPVVQGPDNDAYLHTTYEGTSNFAGSIFLDYQNQGDFSDGNTIVYGHNMKNLSMFGKLKQMKEQEKYRDSVYFWMLTPESNDVYQIFSAFYTEADSDVYTLYSGGGEAFVQYLNTMAARSEIPVEQPEMDENSHIIVLSTCAASDTTGRFVVLGVRRNR